MKCDFCNQEVGEEPYRVLCRNKKDFRVKIYCYCSQCGKELIEIYRREGNWIVEQ